MICLVGFVVGTSVGLQADSAQIAKLIAKLGSEGSLPAMQQLANIGKPAVDSLVKVVDASKGDASAEAIAVLAKIGDERGIDACVRAYNATDEGLARIAVENLTRFKSPKARDFLISQLGKWSKEQPSPVPGAIAMIGKSMVSKVTPFATSSNRQVKIEAIQTLGYLSQSSTVAIIAASLKDPDAEVRVSSLFALIGIRDLNLPQAALEALSDASPEVRRAATDLLSVHGSFEHTPRILPLLADADESVAANAIYCLGELRDPAAIEPLRVITKSEKLKAKAQNAIANIQKWNPGDITVKNAQWMLVGGPLGKRAATFFSKLESSQLASELESSMKNAHPGKMDMTALAFVSCYFGINEKQSVALIKKSLTPPLDSDPDSWTYSPNALRLLFEKRPSDWLLAEMWSASSDGDVAEQLEDALGLAARHDMKRALEYAGSNEQRIRFLARVLSLQVDSDSLDAEDEIIDALSKLAKSDNAAIVGAAKKTLAAFKEERWNSWMT